MPPAKITVCLDEPIGTIRHELYGHFAEHLGCCIEDGLWVGDSSPIPNLGGIRTDVLEALRKLNIPVLRWPGGCYADDYHWEDGVAPRRERPRRVNMWWGQNVETNAFGTHEFIQLCRHLRCEPYLAGNVGSGSVREFRDWVEYCNFAGDSTLARRRGQNGSPMPFGVKYWGVGNENWGCGGNFDPEDYAAEYRRFATYLRDFSGTPLFLIACGPEGNNHDWTRRFFAKLALHENARRYHPFRIHGFAAHFYCGTAGPSATQYDTNQWYELLEKATRIETLVTEQRSIMDEFDPDRRIGLLIDEWGTWHLPTPGREPLHLWQQSSLRDALAAAITLDAFHGQADKLVMGNIAQVANVLQSMVLTEGEKMLLTPTYHVFDMYQPHRGARSVRAEFEGPPVTFAAGNERRRMAGLLGSASVSGDELTVSVVNPHATLPVEAAIDLRGGNLHESTATVLTHEDVTAHNTFDAPETVAPLAVRGDGGEVGAWTFPAASVTVLRARLAR
jgi:alpha-L-arabinofuranosidase